MRAAVPIGKVAERHSPRFPVRTRIEEPSGHIQTSHLFTEFSIYRKTACPCGGGCPTCQAKSSGLKISQPNDPAEIEADQIADRMMRMSIDGANPEPNLAHEPIAIHRRCDACDTEEQEETAEPVIHKKAFAYAAPDSPSGDMPPSIREVLNSGGQPLDTTSRRFFEPRFGRDFSDVRVHTDARAAESAHALNALAYTVGKRIVFGEGQFAPHSSTGRRLMTHELVHVVQQEVGASSFKCMGHSRQQTMALQRQVSSQQQPPRTLESVRSDTTPGMPPVVDLNDPVYQMDPMASLLYTRITEWVAARHHSNPLHRQLVHHYVRGRGADFHLTLAQMRQVIAPGSNHLNILGSPRWSRVQEIETALDALVRASPNGKASLPVQATATLACDDNLPSLGGFTARISGVVTGYLGSCLRYSDVARIPIADLLPDTVYFHFMGTMVWEDWWDFDPHIPDPHGFPQTRTTSAEENTRLAHDLLPGMPYRVISGTIPVAQLPGASAAVW